MEGSVYRLRRSRLRTSAWAPLVLGGAVFIVVAMAEDLVHNRGFDLTQPVFAVLPAALALAALWPVRVLVITPHAIRFRGRPFPLGEHLGRALVRPREVAWADVAEILLAAGPDRLTMVIGFGSADGPGLGATALELPAREEPAIVAAIAAAAPALALARGTRAEILTRARQPFLARGRTPRARRILTAVVVLAVAGLLVSATWTGDHWAASARALVGLVLVRVAALPPALIIGETQIVMVSWGRRRVVPWAAVGSVRLTAAGERARLVLRLSRPLGRLPAGRELTCRLPAAAGLDEVEAVIRTYAPPHALTAVG